MIDQRDKYRKQVGEMEREVQALKEKLASGARVRPEGQKQDGPSEAELNNLRMELSRLKQESQSIAEERDRLAEENNGLRKNVETLETRIHRLEMECQR